MECLDAKVEGVSEENIGDIVIAEVLDKVDDPVYKMRTRIKTGSLEGKECFVAYRGEPEGFEDIVIRLCFPRRRSSNLNLEDVTYAGYFIRSSIPDDFESSGSDNTILYGKWEDRLKGEFVVPIIPEIKKYYDPGGVLKILHYVSNRGFILPYGIVKHNPPEIDRSVRIDEEGGERIVKIRPIGNALRHYISKISRAKARKGSGFPCIVTIDENVDFVDRILPEMVETGLQLIRMEAQR